MAECNNNETLEDKLRDKLRHFVKSGDFKLVSGKPTNIYIDIKEATTNPIILKLICNIIIKKMISYQIDVNYISCVELGGVLIAGLLSAETELPLIIVRKELKDYGLKRRLIGNFSKGQEVLFVEDVTTTGGSSIEAINILRKEGLIVDKVITIVDREENANKEFSNQKIELIPLFKLSELINK